MIRRKCRRRQGARTRSGRCLDDEQDDAPRRDEHRQEQAAQYAQAEALSREGSALRVAIAQALTLGTARTDAVLVRTDTDDQIAVRERHSQEIQTIDDARTTILGVPIGEPHGVIVRARERTGASRRPLEAPSRPAEAAYIARGGCRTPASATHRAGGG